LEGHITHDTTWTLANSPYTVVKDVVIDAGVKLIIEPGVEVRFDKNVSLTIYGSFEAIGTKNNPIIITSNEIFPAVGDWNTIEFKGSANDTFLYFLMLRMV